MRACSGVWVAHGSGIADRETVDAHGPRARAAGRGVVPRCAACGSPRRRRRATTTASPTRASGRCATSRTRARSSAPRTGSTTARSTSKFADAVCEEVDSRRSDRARAGLPLRARAADDPRAAAARDDHHVLAHPLAERRALRHLPVARGAASRACSARASSASTPSSTATTSSTRSTLPRGRIDREANAVVQGGAQHAGAALPDLDRVAGALARRASPPVAECRAAVRAELGLAPDALLGVGVDRLDYTKGIEERLLRSTAARALPRVPRPLHLRAARGAEPHARSSATASSTSASRRSPSAINAQVGARRLPADRAAARAPRAADGVPLLPRRRRSAT